jgi:hypothetical protein
LIGTQQSNSKWARRERHHIVLVIVVVILIVVAVIVITAIAGEAEVQADGRWRHDER